MVSLKDCGRRMLGMDKREGQEERTWKYCINFLS